MVDQAECDQCAVRRVNKRSKVRLCRRHYALWVYRKACLWASQSRNYIGYLEEKRVFDELHDDVEAGIVFVRCKSTRRARDQLCRFSELRGPELMFFAANEFADADGLMLISADDEPLSLPDGWSHMTMYERQAWTSRQSREGRVVAVPLSVKSGTILCKRGSARAAKPSYVYVSKSEARDKKIPELLHIITFTRDQEHVAIIPEPATASLSQNSTFGAATVDAGNNVFLGPFVVARSRLSAALCQLARKVSRDAALVFDEAAPDLTPWYSAFQVQVQKDIDRWMRCAAQEQERLRVTRLCKRFARHGAPADLNPAQPYLGDLIVDLSPEKADD